MGKWAQKHFGREEFERVGILMAGNDKQALQDELMGCFDNVVFKNTDPTNHAYLGEKNGRVYSVVFNVYGAPAAVDVMAEMYDGGCRTVVFVGYAYGGFKNHDIGVIVVPSRSYHFDGIYHGVRVDKEAGFPDAELKRVLEGVLRKENMNFVEGVNVSVPAVTFQLPHNNQDYKKISPDTCEMELAACFSRAKELGMRAVGVLVVSDNRKESIGFSEKRELKYAGKKKVFSTLVKNLKKLDLPELPQKKKFKIDEHLASIIHDPNDENNVYRDGA